MFRHADTEALWTVRALCADWTLLGTVWPSSGAAANFSIQNQITNF
jgi:hypothetical protein